VIVVGYNGFTRSADLFGRVYGRTGIDRFRVLGHDAAAAVIVDGRLVAAVEEERLNREKKTSDHPVRALRWVLDEAGIDFGDVDCFAFPWDFSPEVWDADLARIAAAPLPTAEKFDRYARLAELHRELVSPEAIRADFAARTGFDLPEDRLRLVPHHLAHLMCGYHLSGWADAAFLVSDGRAERYSSILGEVRDGVVTIFEDACVDIPNSLALLYSKVTRYLGFVPNNDEYKVMGLSAFQPTLDANPLLERVVRLHEGGGYSLTFEHPLLDTQAYYPLFDEVFERSVPHDDWDFRRRVARAVQEVVEVVTRHQVAALERRSDLPRLLIEGGLALNCVNNTKLLEGSRFSDAAVSFGASDPGVTIGAAVYASIALGVRTSGGGSPYLGPSHDRDEIRTALDAYRDRVEVVELPEDEVAAEIAKRLLEPVVIGWFQGRTEYGPRALGNRSIIANPAFADIQDVINTRVKHREQFRPFAPVLLEVDASRVLRMGKKASSPYMTFVFDVRPEWRDAIPGVCHVDGTARAQTVTDASNPRMAALLRSFQDLSGVPCLVNTSFNVAGEPIVSSPTDAIECFLGTDIDLLVLDHFLVSKVVSTDGI
jgi:carbamoyltransferase